MYQRLPDAPGASSGRWDAAPDLERFLSSFYRYYEVKGKRGVMAIQLMHIGSLTFTIAFSFVLLFLVDWQALLSCNAEESCRAVNLVHSSPFLEMGPRRFGVLLCYTLFVVYGGFNVLAAFHHMRDASEMSTYYKERLGIVSDEALETMLWSEVVSRLVQQQKASPFCIVQDELTVLEISNIIMREDNFMIALTNHHAFTKHLPPWLPARLVYTRAVLWNLRASVFFHGALDHRSRLRAEFLDRPEALAQRLRVMGLLNLLLVLPVLIFVCIFFFMRHAEEFRSHRGSPFRRQWTDYAQWHFREFNELPHQFKARLCAAHSAAEAYVRATRSASPLVEAIQRWVKFVAGSILAVLLLVALWDDTPLLFVKIQDKNLLWYLAFFGFLFAVADSAGEDGSSGGSGGSRAGFFASPQAIGAPLRMYVSLMRLFHCTHFLPESWRAPTSLSVLAASSNGIQRARLCQHFRHVRQELLTNFFIHRVQALAEELLGVVLCPLLLIVYMPQVAPLIVDIMRQTKHASPCLGDWCSFGCLDPSRNGSDQFAGQAAAWGSTSSVGGARLEGSGSVRSRGRLYEEGISSNDGKLEKSALTFLLAHRWAWPAGEEMSSGTSSSSREPSHRWKLNLTRPASWSRAATAAVPSHRSEGARHPLFIPLVDMRASGSEVGQAEEEEPDAERCAEWHAEGVPSSTPEAHTPVARPSSLGLPADGEADWELDRLWGYPASALRLLLEIEELQKQELGPEGSRAELYALLPPELYTVGSLGLKTVSPSVAAAGALGAFRDVGGTAADAMLDIDTGAAGAHIFWLEVLRDLSRWGEESISEFCRVTANTAGMLGASSTLNPAG